MAFFNHYRRPGINEGVNEFRANPAAVLLDVRSPKEYMEGRIPGSKNIPLQSLDKVASVAKNKSVPLYVYCQSGVRSDRAVHQLKQMGYQNVKNIGGMSAYSGKVEQ